MSLNENYVKNKGPRSCLPALWCFCHLYPEFINSSVGHVVTGDVSIVKKKKLRNIFKKGYKFIEPIYKNKYCILQNFKQNISSYIKNLSLKYSLNLAYFDGWKALVINKFKGKIFNVSISSKRNQSIFKLESKDVNLLGGGGGSGPCEASVQKP